MYAHAHNCVCVCVCLCKHVYTSQTHTHLVDETSEAHSIVQRHLFLPLSHAHGHLDSLNTTKCLQLVQIPPDLSTLANKLQRFLSVTYSISSAGDSQEGSEYLIVYGLCFRFGMLVVLTNRLLHTVRQGKTMEKLLKSLCNLSTRVYLLRS